LQFIWFIVISCLLLFFDITAAMTQFSLNNRHNIKEDVEEIPLELSPQRTSDQLLLLFIDGMRYDKMIEAETPTIDLLMAEGVTFSNHRSVLPSYSIVNYMAFGTGSTPNITEVISNGNKKTAQIPSIFSIAQEGNLSTGVVSDSSWNQLFKPWITTNVHVENEYHSPDVREEVRDVAITTIANNFSEIQLVGFSDVDAYGHLVGAAASEYIEAIEEIDGYLGEIISLYDTLGHLENTTIVLFSDHGMSDEKGHGGIKGGQDHASLVITGKGITNTSSTISEKTRMNDVIPTLLSLLGLPVAPTMNGRIIYDILEISQQNKAIYALQSASIMTQQFSVSIPKLKILSQNSGSFYQEQLEIIQENITIAEQSFNINQYSKAFQEGQEAESLARIMLSAIYSQYAAVMRLTRALIIIGVISLIALVFFILAMKNIIQIDLQGVFSKRFLLPQLTGFLSFCLIAVIVFVSTGFSYEPSKLNSAAETLIPNLTTFFIGGGALIFIPWLVLFLLERKQKQNEKTTFKEWLPDFLKTSIGSIAIYSIPIILYELYYIFIFGPWPIWQIPDFGYLYAYMIIGVFSCFYFMSGIIMQIVLWKKEKLILANLENDNTNLQRS
jgi:predicted AlkP superfamily pyrophosphatase or phosphodiesterase